MATEKRLIDANILKTAFENAIKVCKSPQIKRIWLIALKAANDCPTIDAVEVVHGHMVERIVDHECPWYKVYDCSECGCSVESWHNYCPNCGAKMDGDGNG